MPAPVPIQIQYGDTASLLGLASATGQAQYAQSNYQRQYNDYLQRMSLDQSFLNSEANRRQQDQEFRNQLDFNRNALQMKYASQDNANELQDAYHQAQLALKAKTSADYQNIDQEKVDAINRRLDAQISGQIGSARGRGSQAADLVPAEGPISGEGTGGYGIIQNTETGDATEDRNGKVTQANLDGLALRGPDAWSRINAAENPAQGEMVTRGIRRQLDMIRAAQDTLAPEDVNAMMAAVRGGTIKDDQLLDDMRQSRLKITKTPLSAVDRQGANLAAQAKGLQGVLDSNDPAQIAEAANAVLHAWGTYNAKTPENVQKATTALQTYVDRISTQARSLAPVANSSGTSMTGGNPVPVNSEAELLALPPGTYATMNGRLLRRP
jgi:hypothetical protein